MSVTDEINEAESAGLKHFTVCFRHPGATIETFSCWAEDEEHADEQARNAYPDSDILGSLETREISNPYYDQLEHDSEELAIAACQVVQNWESGDLAGKVTLLDSLLDDLPWFDREGVESAVSEG